MAKSKVAESFEIACPCCGALIVVDPSVHGVISHTPPPSKRTFENLDAATHALKDQETRRESLFRQSVEAERNKADLLNRKFEEAMKKAKDSPVERPLRDFDLD
ncbi:MAG: hypothetical protein JOZ43_01720 [Acidobacteriales bacterium]|nr:hypothetical protein [Terriglobales bacterium]